MGAHDQLAHDARSQQWEEDARCAHHASHLRHHCSPHWREPNPGHRRCRRVNQAIWLLTTGARDAAFRNIKTIAECLAEEIINAAKGSSNSYAIKKKDEIERVAKANR